MEIAPATQSRSNIDLMIAAGNSVIFDPQDSGCSSDLRPTSLEWNTSANESDYPIDFKYAVDDGPLPTFTTAALFWAKGTNIADKLSDAPFFTLFIPSGTTNGESSTNFVAATFLQNPSNGTTHVLLVIDPGDLIVESNETNNTRALPWVQLGIDVSHKQNDRGTIDWSAVTNSGKRFAFVKATEGKTGPNDAFTSLNVPQARSFGLLVGTYRICYPQNNTNAVEEVTNFLSHVTNYIGAGYLPPVLDLETTNADYYVLTQGHAASELAFWVKAWLQSVELRTGVRPIIYTSRSVLKSYLNGGFVAAYPLWIATRDRDVTGTPSLSTGQSWPNWQFKQYQDEKSGGVCNGITGDADLDSFHGDLNALRSLTNALPSPPYFTGVGGGVIQPPSNGKFQLEIFVPSQQQIVVKASRDLFNWTDTSALTPTNGIAVFTDSGDGTNRSGFYRLKP